MSSGKEWDFKQERNQSNQVQQPGVGLISELSSNQVQTMFKQELLELERTLRGLSGNNLRVFNFLAETMIKKSLASFETSYSSMSESLGMPIESIKTVFKRLSKKGLLFSQALKGGGRGTKRTVGICRNVMPVYLEVMNFKSEEVNWAQFQSQPQAPTAITQDLPQEWLDIQVPDPVEKIGFGVQHIKQLFRLYPVKSAEIQESLEAFSYDLELGVVQCSGSKLGFLMSVLRDSGSYVSESMLMELKSQVEANQNRKRQMVNMKRKQAEEKLTKKAQEMIEYMTDEEKLSMYPESAVVKFGTPAYDQLLLISLVEELQNTR